MYLTENWFKMWLMVVNHNYVCHICAKRFLILTYNEQLPIDKISIFNKIAQISHTKFVIFQV